MSADALNPEALEDSALRRALFRLIAIGGSAVLASYLLVLDPAIGGGGATVLAGMLVRLAAVGPATAWVAVIAFFFFWLQTMVLDALVWPHYY